MRWLISDAQLYRLHRWAWCCRPLIFVAIVLAYVTRNAPRWVTFVVGVPPVMVGAVACLVVLVCGYLEEWRDIERWEVTR